MSERRIVAGEDEVLRAIEQSKRPLSETEVMLNRQVA